MRSKNSTYYSTILNFVNKYFYDVGRSPSTREIEGGTGRLSFSGSALHDLEMGLGVGDVTMEAALSGDCEIECGVGKAEISLLGNRSDYSIAVEKGIGKATVNGESVSNEQTVGNGKNKLEIHGGIGSVLITVAE